MKKFLIALILFSASFTALSQSLIDGMSVHNLPSNRDKYYYGEPIILYFLTKNETDKIKRYWGPTTSINVKLELVDLRSGKTFYYAHESSGYGHMRNYWVDNPPPVEASFSPMDTKFLNYILGDSFRLDKLFVNKGSAVLYRYARVLPVGKYSLRLTYFLLPSKHQLAVRHEFEVVSVPGSEKEAFHDYVKAFEYACISHPVYGDNSYSVSAPKSFETFIAKYPSSVYAQYAIHLSANWIHSYLSPNPSSLSLIEDYLYNEDTFILPDLKVDKAFRTGVIVRSFEEHLDKEKAYDKVLKTLKKENPHVSEWLIKHGESSYNLKGLKNYACDEN